MLNWTIAYDENRQILVVKTSGALKIEFADMMRAEALAIIRQKGCVGCLLDHSELEADLLTTLDIYYLPKKYQELGIHRNFKLALVVPSHLAENLRFFETVCRNNGYSVSIFFDHPSALAWLEQPASTRPATG